MVFTGYKVIATMLVVIEIAVIIFTNRRSPRTAFYITLISVFIKGQYLWLGWPIYAWQFAAMLGLVFAVSPSIRARYALAGRILSHYRHTTFLFFVYSFLISIPLWLLFKADGLGTAQTAVNLTRCITQSVYTIFLLGLFCYGIRAGRYVTIYDFLRAIINVSTATAYFAILQVIIFNQLGIDIFPIIGSDDTIRSAYTYHNSGHTWYTTFRATSFVGEPKHLGILMAGGISTIFLMQILRIPIGRYPFHKPIVMGVALLLSLSSTGIFLSILGNSLLSLVFFTKIRKVDMLFLFCLISVGWIQANQFDGNFRGALEKQASRREFEVQDQSVYLALIEEPILAITGSGLGNIHLFAVDHLPNGFPLFRNGGYKANSGLFFIVGDSGLIGLVLLLAGPIFGMYAYRLEKLNYRPSMRHEVQTALSFLLLIALSFLFRYNEILFLVSGFVYSRLVVLRQEARSRFLSQPNSLDFSFIQRKSKRKLDYYVPIVWNNTSTHPQTACRDRLKHLY
jgi:hypothetical protein